MGTSVGMAGGSLAERYNVHQQSAAPGIIRGVVPVSLTNVRSAVGDEVVPRRHKPARVTRCSGYFDGTILSFAEYATDPDSLGGAP